MSDYLSHVSLALATVADVPALHAIEIQAHRNPWSKAIFERTLVSNKVIYTLSDNGQIIAYLVGSIVVGEAELLNLTVVPSHQKKGLGNYLLTHWLQQIESKVEQVFLEVRESNAAAIRLYESQGFDIIDRRINYYPSDNGQEDALIMARHFC